MRTSRRGHRGLRLCIIQLELVLVDTLQDLIGTIHSFFVEENRAEPLAISLSRLEQLNCWYTGVVDVRRDLARIDLIDSGYVV